MKRNLTFLVVAGGVICVVWGVILYFATKPHKTNVAPAIESTSDTMAYCRVRLVFAGDLMQHVTQIRAAQTADGFDYSESFRYVKDLFHDANVAILNLETTLTPRAPYTGFPLFRSPKQIADLLQDIGIDVVVLANNHICDNGYAGIQFTTGCLDSSGIAYTGAFADSMQFLKRHPLRFEANGIRFALLNYTYGTNGMPVPKKAIVNLIDTAKIASDLAKIDRNSTACVIVFFHWGDEYARYPNSQQRMLDAFCRRHGADMVIGSHPHTIQPFENHLDADSVTRAVTVYSLGNLVSNQRWRYSDGGLIAAIDIEKPQDKPFHISLKPIPVWVMMPNYRILPEWVADTIPMNAQQRARYEQFVADTRKLLNIPCHP